MKINQKKALTSLMVLLMISLVVIHHSKKESDISDRQAYAEYITNHPYANRSIDLDELENTPKFDRPDLAAEHNFLQVVDPALNRIPTERLVTAFNYSKKILEKRNSISGKSGKANFRSIEANPSTSNARSAQGRAAIPNVNWSERGPNNVGGRTRALMWDPNDANATKVWAGSVSGGIWFNNDITDANSLWVPVDDFLGSLAISSFAYDPNDTETFYAGTGEGFIAGNGGGGVAGVGLYKSTDAGATWDLLSSTTGPDYRYIQKVIVTDNSTVLISSRPSLNEGGSSGIFRSTDGGSTWTNVISGRGADLQLASNGDIYASTGIGTGSGQVWRSTNDGVDWTEVTPPGGNPLWIELAVAPSQSSETSSTRIYALAQDASTRTSVTWFQRSDDGGANWTNLEIPRNVDQGCNETSDDFTRGQAFYDLIVAVQPNNADVVTMGGIDIYRSTEAGNNMELVSYWTGACDAFVHADQHEAAYRPGFPNEAVFGHDGGVSYSDNVGDPNASNPNFFTRNNNYSVTQFYAVAGRNEAGSGNFIAGAQDNGTQRLTDANGASSNQAVGGDGTFCHIDQTDGQFQIASVQFNAVQHSSNGGQSFQGLTGQNTSHAFINPTDLDNSSHILYTAAAGNEYMLIRDINTSNPSEEEFISVNVGNISHLNANSTTDHRLFIGTRQGGIFRIDDAHTSNPTVTNISGNITTGGNVSSIDIGSSDNQLVATFSNFGVSSVWLSLDGGDTWVNKDDSHGLPDIPVRWALFNPNNTNQVLLATEIGVWSTDNILADNPGWEPTSNNLANVRCDMLQYREADGNVIVATFGRGVFTTDAFSDTQDTSPPSIVSLNPSDDEIEVLLDINLEVSFNESVQKGSGSISILRSADDSVFETIDVSGSNVTTSGATLIIDPTSNLEPSTEYYVNLDAGIVTDSNGNSFDGLSDNSTWNFMTFDGDFPPTVENTLGVIRLIRETGNASVDVDLTSVFDDVDNDNSSITFEITANDNESFISTSISGSTLTISTLVPNQIGEASLTLRGTSNGKFADDNFLVIVSDEILYDQSIGTPVSSIISMQMTDRADTLVQLADDFSVPSGDLWEPTGITVFGSVSAPAEGQTNIDITAFVVEIYEDINGGPNDNVQVYKEQFSVTYTPDQTSIRLPINLGSLLSSGNYWISVYSVSEIERSRWNWLALDTDPEISGEWAINDRQSFFGLQQNVWLSAGNAQANLADQDAAFILEGVLQDGTKPPSDLSLSVESESSISLNWVDNADNELGFVIERSTSANTGFAQVATVDVNETSFTDTELSSNSRYFYRVIASGSLADSEPSSIINTRTLPAAPTEVSITDPVSGAFTVSWVSADNATSFEVDISDDNFATFVNVFESFAVQGQTTLEAQLSEATDYQIRVRAINSSGVSANSEVFNFTIEALGLSNPNTFEFGIYPNPVKSNVSLSIPSHLNDDFTVSIIDLSGKVTHRSKISSIDNSAQLELSNLTNGIYIITLESEHHFSKSRFSKVK